MFGFPVMFDSIPTVVKPGVLTTSGHDERIVEWLIWKQARVTSSMMMASLTYDRKARVWYAPDKGLEFDTVAEIEENYGPIVAASDSE